MVRIKGHNFQNTYEGSIIITHDTTDGDGVVSKLETPWTSELITPNIKDFIGNVRGPTVPISDQPLDVFQLFYTPSLIDSIVYI